MSPDSPLCPTAPQPMDSIRLSTLPDAEQPWPWRDKTWYARVIFWLGLFCCFLCYSWLTADTIRQRSVAIEMDDAYSYIAKGILLDSWFRGNDSAFLDLKAQLLPVDKSTPAIQYDHAKTYQCAVSLYPLGFAVLLAIIHACGASWEAAYNILQTAGPFLFFSILACLLRGLFGSLTAGVALILLAPTVFFEHGLHILVPNTLALFWALALWSYILLNRRRRLWPLVLLAILCASAHPAGVIYTGIASLLCPGSRWLRKETIRPHDPLILAAIAFAFVALPHIPGFEYFLAPSLPYQQVVDLWTTIQLTIKTAIAAVVVPNGLFSSARMGHDVMGALPYVAPNALAAVIVLGVGLWKLPRQTRSRIVLLAVLLTGALFLQVLCLQQYSPAMLFRRLVTPLNLILYGVAAQGILMLLYWLGKTVRRGFCPATGCTDGSVGASRGRGRLLAVLAIGAGVAGLVILVNIHKNKFRRLQDVKAQIVERFHSPWTPPEFRQTMTAITAPGERIAADDLVNLLCVQLLDLKDRGLVFLPTAKRKKEKGVDWLGPQGKITSALLLNPYPESLVVPAGGTLLIRVTDARALTALQIEPHLAVSSVSPALAASTGRSPEALVPLVASPANPATRQTVWSLTDLPADPQPLRVARPINADPTQKEPQDVRWIKLRNQGNVPVELTSVRLLAGTASPSRWSWLPGVRMQLLDAQGKSLWDARPYEQLTRHLPGIAPARIRILNDTAKGVLVQVLPDSPTVPAGSGAGK